MARVTVEDCIDKIPNRFELVLTSSQRAREIGSGAPLTVERDNDKNSVVSLREIEDETISLEELQENLIRSFQKVTFLHDDDEDEAEIDLMDGENDWSALANFGDDGEKLIGAEGMHETSADAEKQANKPAEGENEFMVGQAIDPSTVPDELLKYKDSE